MKLLNPTELPSSTAKDKDVQEVHSWPVGQLDQAGLSRLDPANNRALSSIPIARAGHGACSPGAFSQRWLTRQKRSTATRNVRSALEDSLHRERLSELTAGSVYGLYARGGKFLVNYPALSATSNLWSLERGGWLCSAGITVINNLHVVRATFTALCAVCGSEPSGQRAASPPLFPSAR